MTDEHPPGALERVPVLVVDLMGTVVDVDGGVQRLGAATLRAAG